MIAVTQKDFEDLVEAKLIRFSSNNKNFVILNKNKKGSQKKYYVVEEHRILKFLGISVEDVNKNL